jgi:hypothetical protein
VRIYNTLGKEVYRQNVFIQKQISLPVYQLPRGMYMVEINYEGKRELRKFVKE